MLETIAQGVWSVPAPFKILGLIHLNGRMTIVRLRDGGLWIHSPVPINAKLQESIDALGPVRALVAPSRLHHMFVQPWKDAYPQAKIYAAKGLAKKRPDLSIDAVIEDTPLWEEFHQKRIRGMPAVQEVLFLHRDSQTLITTDFLFYMPDASGFTNFYAWLNGFKQRVSTPFIFRSVIKDKTDFVAASAGHEIF